MPCRSLIKVAVTTNGIKMVIILTALFWRKQEFSSAILLLLTYNGIVCRRTIPSSKHRHIFVKPVVQRAYGTGFGGLQSWQRNFSYKITKPNGYKETAHPNCLTTFWSSPKPKWPTSRSTAICGFAASSSGHLTVSSFDSLTLPRKKAAFLNSPYFSSAARFYSAAASSAAIALRFFLASRIQGSYRKARSQTMAALPCSPALPAAEFLSALQRGTLRFAWCGHCICQGFWQRLCRPIYRTVLSSTPCTRIQVRRLWMLVPYEIIMQKVYWMLSTFGSRTSATINRHNLIQDLKTWDFILPKIRHKARKNSHKWSFIAASPHAEHFARRHSRHANSEQTTPLWIFNTPGLTFNFHLSNFSFVTIQPVQLHLTLLVPASFWRCAIVCRIHATNCGSNTSSTSTLVNGPGPSIISQSTVKTPAKKGR